MGSIGSAMTNRHHVSARLSTGRLETGPRFPCRCPPGDPKALKVDAPTNRRDRGHVCESDTLRDPGASPDGGAPGWSRDVWAGLPALRREIRHPGCRRVPTGKNERGGSAVERSLQGIASSGRAGPTSAAAIGATPMGPIPGRQLRLLRNAGRVNPAGAGSRVYALDDKGPGARTRKADEVLLH